MAHFNKLSSSVSLFPQKYIAVEHIWPRIRLGLFHFVLAGSKRRRIGVVVLILAVLFLLPFTLLSAFFVVEFNFVFIFLTWLTFGLLCVGVGSVLKYILHPEHQAYQRVIESCNQAVRATQDQEILLDHITHILFNTLGLESLSVWRYNDEASILELSRLEGLLAADDLVELPLDISTEKLCGTWYVSALPGSALRQGLITLGVQVITSLSLGGELIGVIGLGKANFGKQHNLETLHWLNWMAGQLSLVVQDARLTADLDEIRHKLQHAYRRAIDAHEEERCSLATELHDDILGRLTTMALTLHKCQINLATKPDQVSLCLRNLEADTQSVNRRLREITKGLYPSVLTDLGLISAIRAYVDSLSRQPESVLGTQTIALTAQGFDQDRIPVQKLERDLYYITRQALDNALKHAHAQQIFIHLRWDEEAVSLTVRDTGTGMANTPETLMGQEGHLGLLSMHDRTLAWRGKLTFYTAPEQGTTVRARLPIDQPSPTPAHIQVFTQYLN